jgi:hypothetical protein
MQAASDIFLGWVRATGVDGLERDFYIRQLWDWKGSVELDSGVPSGLRVYGQLWGWTLAPAHARSGDPIAIRLPRVGVEPWTIGLEAPGSDERAWDALQAVAAALFAEPLPAAPAAGAVAAMPYSEWLGSLG